MPTADHFDPLDLEGFLGLQVHSGPNTHVRWCNPTLRDLGTRRWEPVEGWTAGALEEWNGLTGDSPPWAAGVGPPDLGDDLTDFCLRLELRLERGRFALAFRDLDGPPSIGRDATPVGPEAPGLHAWDAGWLFEPTDPAHAKRLKDDWQELVLSHYGDRLAVHLDGRLLLDRAGLPRPDTGAIAIKLAGESRLELRSAELLGEPRR